LTKLILVRHAESTWNQTGRYQGRIDTELSEQGQKQASLLAERLSSVPLAAIYASPLRRALHTAITIGVAQSMDIRVEPDLTEIDHGAWNGLLKDEVEKRFGPLLQQWLVTPSKVQMPGGESLVDVGQRAKAVLSRILADHPTGTVVVCSHDAVLKVLIADLIGMHLDRFWSFGICNASISIVECNQGFNRLLCLNDACHLGPYRTETDEQAL